jgi:hypothetical protein
MCYPLLEAIRGSCPAIQQRLVDATKGTPVVEIEQYEQGVGRARCDIDVDTIIAAGITWGCRNITAVSSTGCPLRDGGPVKVRL